MKLTLDDIADLRAYERDRASFRERVIALKKRRRVAVGPHVTLLFESRDTVRFQVQEMARAERMLSDAAIQTELDIYNPLIPDRGELSATLFVELTTERELREWLPRLVGIERAVELDIAGSVVPAGVDPSHAARLTREDVTASVHYVRWGLTPPQAHALEAGPVTLRIDHPAYRFQAVLDGETRTELAADATGAV